MNYTNINYNNITNIPKNIKKRNSMNNYTKQITHFALKKSNNGNNLKQYNNKEIFGLVSPRNNNDIINKTIQKYFISPNKTKEINLGNITMKSKNNTKINFQQFNIKNIAQYKNGNFSKISLKHNINNNKIKKINLDNLYLLQNNNKNNIKQNKIQKLQTQEIKIKNSKLIDYIKKSKSYKKDENINSNYNNNNFNINATFDKYGKRRRNLSFNIFNNYNNDNNPLLPNNNDSYMNNNNLTFLSNGSMLSNNNNISEKRVIFNRKIDYKKNKFNGDYIELAKICADQEKIISDLVKNVQNLNNQICDKDLCINELNNQLYSIKYDLLNTLQKTNGKS